MNPSYKIAIIEDDVAIAQMYRLKFENQGFIVQTAENGQLGLELIKEFKPDVVLLDLQMPIMDGESVLKTMRQHGWSKNIPVIVLTNVGEEEAPKSLSELDVDSYIVKAQLTPRQVTEHVKAVLATA